MAVARRSRPVSAVIMLCMPVCPRYLLLIISSAWRAQFDNERGVMPAQRNRPMRCPAPDCHQRAFLHVTHFELGTDTWLKVAPILLRGNRR